LSEPFLGEIRMVGFNFAPRGWALCNGQLLSIAQNTALFSLLGTTYGGNGQTTFALPDLRGRSALHFGQGPGLSNYTQGEVAGTETVTLTINEMPAHNHILGAQSTPGSSTNPSNNYPAGSSARDNQYSNAANANMNPSALSVSGGSQPHTNMPPYLVINFVIALEGIYPSRP
jgi:microcystin-dependent protein